MQRFILTERASTLESASGEIITREAQNLRYFRILATQANMNMQCLLIMEQPEVIENTIPFLKNKF